MNKLELIDDDAPEMIAASLVLVAVLAGGMYSAGNSVERNQSLHEKCKSAHGMVLYSKAGALVCVNPNAIIEVK